MRFEERVAALAPYRFTPRQAAFLTTVMLHSGVCLTRQYTKFARIASGHNARDFFARLTRDKFATAYASWRRQGTYFHVHHKGLYRAIGEPDNRHRRRSTIPRTVERLMLLDAVLEAPGVRWLTTEREKIQHFTTDYDKRIEFRDLPAIVFDRGGLQTIRYFPDKLPIGVISSLDLLFLFVVTDPNPEPIRRFMRSHRKVLERVYRWRLRLVFPPHLAASDTAYKRAIFEFFPEPLYLSQVDEFKWYSKTRRDLDHGRVTLTQTEVERYAKARRSFSSRRFYSAYRDWLTGSAGLHVALVEASAGQAGARRGAGRDASAEASVLESWPSPQHRVSRANEGQRGGQPEKANLSPRGRRHGAGTFSAETTDSSAEAAGHPMRNQ